jgi:hypothetical protein
MGIILTILGLAMIIYAMFLASDAGWDKMIRISRSPWDPVMYPFRTRITRVAVPALMLLVGLMFAVGGLASLAR